MDVAAKIEDPADIPVRDLSGDLNLPPEAIEGHGVARRSRQNGLQCHALAELLIEDLVDLSHATPGEEPLHPVAAGEHLIDVEVRVEAEAGIPGAGPQRAGVGLSGVTTGIEALTGVGPVSPPTSSPAPG